MSSPTGVVEELHALHESYTFKVNAAVASDQWDLVSELTDAYYEDAQAALSAAATADPDRR
jgi:hypothetical protein